jgi:hypothetical protein
MYKKAKNNIEFDKGLEGQSSVVQKNISNFPYSDSKSETPMEEREETEVESPALEVPPTSTNNKINKESKIQKLEEEVTNLKLLERVIKLQNQAMKRTSEEVRDSFERLSKMHVKEHKKTNKLLKENHKLHKIVRCLRIKLILKDPKTKTHLDLESLVEAIVNLNKYPEG